MAGLIRVRSIGNRRRRAGFAFSRDWAALDGTQVDEAQFLAILEDGELLVEGAHDAENPVWWPMTPEQRAGAIAALRHHIEFDLAEGRDHDLLAASILKFQSAEGAEDRTETGASISGASEAKDGTGTDDIAAPSADPQGGETSTAEGSQESREGTDDDATAQVAASDGEKEPEESPRPPVAVPDQAEAAAPAPATEAPATKSAGSRRRKA